MWNVLVSAYKFRILRKCLKVKATQSCLTLCYSLDCSLPGSSLHTRIGSIPFRGFSIPSLGQEDPLEKEMATHSSILAWRIPWTEEPGGLQSLGSQRVGHKWVSNTQTVTIIRSSIWFICKMSCLLIVSYLLWF